MSGEEETGAKPSAPLLTMKFVPPEVTSRWLPRPEEIDGQLGTRRFRIWAQGRLDERFSEGLAGIEQEDVPAGTILSGAMLDQSRMHSTLDLLRSLGIDVLRFEVHPPRAPSSTGLAEPIEAPGQAMRYRHLHESIERPSNRDGGHDKEKD